MATKQKKIALVVIPTEQLVEAQSAYLAHCLGYPGIYPSKDEVNLPTLNEMQRWLRIGHKQEMSLSGGGDYFNVFVDCLEGGWIYKNTQKENNPTSFNYEEGQQAGINEILEYLIEGKRKVDYLASLPPLCNTTSVKAITIPQRVSYN